MWQAMFSRLLWLALYVTYPGKITQDSVLLSLCYLKITDMCVDRLTAQVHCRLLSDLLPGSQVSTLITAKLLPLSLC